MLVDQEKRFNDLDDRTEVSLLESTRQAEWKKREKERLVHQNKFRTSQGMQAIKLDQLLKDTEEDEGEVTEATHRIELNEAARILVDSIRLQAPMAVMR